MQANLDETVKIKQPCQIEHFNGENVKKKEFSSSDLLQGVEIKLKRLKWTAKQTWIYLKFIAQHKEILLEDQKKDKQKIFNRMSEQILTRNSRKCKSHHQKLMSKYKSIDAIIEKLPKQKKWVNDKEMMSLTFSQELGASTNYETEIQKKKSNDWRFDPERIQRHSNQEKKSTKIHEKNEELDKDQNLSEPGRAQKEKDDQI